MAKQKEQKSRKRHVQPERRLVSFTVARRRRAGERGEEMEKEKERLAAVS